MHGRSLVPDGVVLDMRSLNYVRVSEDKASATLGGGVLFGELQKALDEQGLIAATGFCNGVGYVGCATGGGYGVSGGKYGLGVDQMLGARVVTASGEIVDTDDDAELLWGLRGAGRGNFGVVVEVRITVYPPPNMLGGFLVFPLAEGAKVFGGFAELTGTDFPDAFSGDVAVVKSPEAGPVIMFLFTWLQESEDFALANAYLEKMSGLGTVLMNTVQPSKCSRLSR